MKKIVFNPRTIDRQPRSPHVPRQPQLEVQRGSLEVSRKWCWRETESKNVNGKFGILRNYLYLCSVKHKNA